MTEMVSLKMVSLGIQDWIPGTMFECDFELRVDLKGRFLKVKT